MEKLVSKPYYDSYPEWKQEIIQRLSISEIMFRIRQACELEEEPIVYFVAYPVSSTFSFQMKKRKNNKVSAIYHFKGLVQEDETLIIHFSKAGYPKSDCTYIESIEHVGFSGGYSILNASCFEEDIKTLVTFDPIAIRQLSTGVITKRQNITKNPFYPLFEEGTIDLQHFCEDLLKDEFEEDFCYEYYWKYGEAKYKRKYYDVDVTATFALLDRKPVITKLSLTLYYLLNDSLKTMQIDLTNTKYFHAVQEQGYAAIEPVIALYMADSSC